jgi:hypothetical protein
MKHPVEPLLDPVEIAKRKEALKNQVHHVKKCVADEFSGKMNRTNKYIQELLKKDDSPKKVQG